MKITLGHRITVSSKLLFHKLKSTFTLKEKVKAMQTCMKISAGNTSRIALIINYLYEVKRMD